MLKRNIILKIGILLTKNMDIFQVPVLRDIRWFMYRKYFGAPNLYVDSGVDISSAHRNENASFEGTGKINLGKGVQKYLHTITISTESLKIGKKMELRILVLS